jgi:3-dehydroquinate synthase
MTMAEHSAGLERVTVGLDRKAQGSRSYDIVIGPGLMSRLGPLIADVAGDRPLVILTDTTVAGLYRARIEAALMAAGRPAPPVIVVPPGEGSKSLRGFGETAERILALGIDRKTVIVALGGGVVGDLAGFLAATLLRGLDFIQIPTTLLAQVDSSVGGKTGIDSAHGKNLIGAFHQPLLVVADTDTLTTLPPREMKAGYAEIVKYGLLGDSDFFAWLEQNGGAVLAGEPAALRQAIATSCRAKARIVEEDERESGRRALLNLGHTFGHALEAEAGFGDLLNHGEAVAIGIVLAFDLSVRLGYCPAGDLMRVHAHFVRHGLRVSPPRDGDFRPGRLIARMRGDKKAERGRLTFILVRGIGRAFVANGVEPGIVEAALARALAA